MTVKTIAVLGLGNIGKLAARSLHESGFAVTGYDLRLPRESLPFTVDNIDLTCHEAMTGAFPSALFLERGRGECGHQAGVHYFDLTEDVPTTREIIELAKTSKRLMAPQCGLAPGLSASSGPT